MGLTNWHYGCMRNIHLKYRTYFSRTCNVNWTLFSHIYNASPAFSHTRKVKPAFFTHLQWQTCLFHTPTTSNLIFSHTYFVNPAFPHLQCQTCLFTQLQCQTCFFTHTQCKTCFFHTPGMSNLLSSHPMQCQTCFVRTPHGVFCIHIVDVTRYVGWGVASSFFRCEFGWGPGWG